MSLVYGGIEMIRRYGVVLIVCLVAVLFSGSLACGQNVIVLDKVVAVINSEVITWSELYKAMEFEASPAVKALGEQERRKIFRENEAIFLEGLINMKLMLMAAKAANINVSEADVMETVRSIKEKYNLNDDAFKAAIGKEGFTLDEYKKKLLDQLTVSRMIDMEVRSRIIVNDKEIDEYIQKNKDGAADEGYVISMILVKKSDEPARDEERAKAAFAGIKAGKAFADVAREFSDDSSARAGGNLGFLKKSELSTAYLEVLSKMKEGETSEPFQSGAGTHILKLEGARVFKSPAEFRQAVKERIFNEKNENAYKAWVKGLRQSAYVEIK
jgi:peptidyl-prolyl cis-trans isomerase SurA